MRYVGHESLTTNTKDYTTMRYVGHESLTTNTKDYTTMRYVGHESLTTNTTDYTTMRYVGRESLTTKILLLSKGFNLKTIKACPDIKRIRAILLLARLVASFPIPP